MGFRKTHISISQGPTFRVSVNKAEEDKLEVSEFGIDVDGSTLGYNNKSSKKALKGLLALSNNTWIRLNSFSISA